MAIIIDLTNKGIISAEAFGNAKINRTVKPIGIASAEAFGTTIVYHFLLFPHPSEVGDCCLFSYPAKFSGLKIEFGSPGAGGDYVWEFWDGDSWEILEVSDTTEGFIQNGYINWKIPNGWQLANNVDIIPNIGEERYWTRVRILTSPDSDPTVNYLEITFVGQTCRGSYVGAIVPVVIGTDENNYRCILSHTATADNRPITGINWATYWVLGGSNELPWIDERIYGIGSKVPFVIGTDENNYRCILSHTATADNRPITGINWATYWVLDGFDEFSFSWIDGKIYLMPGNGYDPTKRDFNNCYIYSKGGFEKPMWETGLQKIIDRLKTAGTIAIINP